MDFFEHQDAARRKTSLLVFYFFLAVVLIILAVYAVFWLIFAAGAEPPEGAAEHIAPSIWNPTLFAWVAGVTLFVVCIGTITKIVALAGGGEAIARMLGARPVDPNSSDPRERRLINVVEETAIASGTQIPRTFLLEEDNSINAFAAGFSTEDAIIGVTSGCMKQLSRDELQGVIAHEFSHILNGDMRLNIKLMGVLHGILILGIIGYGIFRSALYTAPARSSGRRRDGNPLAFILLGLSVMAIGYIGVFFAKLIKSAVSRQREYLADASAVQFTRNPDGIAGALKKIGALSSRISSPNAEQASHLFFANGLSGSLAGLMATHPPLPDRIRRIDPSFEGDFKQHISQAELPLEKTKAEPQGFAESSITAAAFAEPGRTRPISVNSAEVIQSVGNPQQSHLTYVSRLLASLPDSIRTAAHEPDGAQSLLYGTLLNRDHTAYKKQVQYLADHAEPDIYRKTMKLADTIKKLPPETMLPLADMALSTMRSLSKEQFETFKRNIQSLAAADREISLFEYVLLRMAVRHLDMIFGHGRKHPVKYHDINPLIPHAAVVLSLLAYYGSEDPDEALMMFNTGINKISRRPVEMLARKECGLEQADKALDIMADASPRIKKRLLEAAVQCVTANGRTTISEIEMLRAIADSLECPMPPFLPEQAAA